MAYSSSEFGDSPESGLRTVTLSMFLPQSLTMHQLLKRLCSEYQCRWEKIQSKQESKVWLIDNTVVMVYQGEPRRDLWVDSRAVLRFSDEERKGKSSISMVTENKRKLTLFIPTRSEGKGKHAAHESFCDAYNKMLFFKIRNILMPINTEGSWSATKIVKALLCPLMQLVSREMITTVLTSQDQSRCEAANDTIHQILCESKEKDCTEKKHAIGHNLEEIVLCGCGDDVKTVVRNLQDSTKDILMAKFTASLAKKGDYHNSQEGFENREVAIAQLKAKIGIQKEEIEKYKRTQEEQFQRLQALEKQLAEVRKDGHDTKTALDKLQQAEEAVDQTLKHLGSAHIKLIETERKVEVLRSQLLDKDNDLRQKDEEFEEFYQKLQLSQKENELKSKELNMKTREIQEIQAKLEKTLYFSQKAKQQTNQEEMVAMWRQAGSESKEGNGEVLDNIEAEISDGYMSLFSNVEDLEDTLLKYSGVRLRKHENKWILCGNFQEIERARNYLKEVIVDHKENRPSKSDNFQTNAQCPATNSDLIHKKNVPMTEKEYKKYAAVFLAFEQEGVQSVLYSSDDQCMYITGSKSFVKGIENQRKMLITRQMHITIEMFDKLKAKISNLAKANPPVFVDFEQKEGILEVFGISMMAVDEAVNLFEKD
nr:uncharacterized protein LOC111134262 isoform X2 [Crassostrea virginica]